MGKIEQRPRFGSLFLQDLKDQYDRRGPITLIPIWIIAFLGAGAAISYFVPPSFFDDANWEVSTGLYGAVLALNGLILALSWQAFSRIQSSICAPGFSSFLRRKGLLTGYFFLMDYIQLAQIVAVLVCSVGLVSVLFPNLLLIVDRVILALVIGSSGYALRQGTGAVTLMQDLLWYHSAFDDAAASEAPHQNVTPFPGGKNYV